LCCNRFFWQRDVCSICLDFWKVCTTGRAVAWLQPAQSQSDAVVLSEEESSSFFALSYDKEENRLSLNDCLSLDNVALNL
jgi:hypothetical protein